VRRIENRAGERESGWLPSLIVCSVGKREMDGEQ
jgi:hypothetical protein